MEQQTNDEGPPRASLLGLPGELRNVIYRLALVETDRIVIDAANPVAPQPGLLRTYRQLRNESLKIFYRENSFQYVLVDLKPPGAPDHHQMRLSRYVMLFVGISAGVHVFRWENLLQWLKGCHGRKAPRLPPPGNAGKQVQVLKGAFDIVCQLRRNGKLKWEEIEPILEAWKESVGIGGAISWT